VRIQVENSGSFVLRRIHIYRNAMNSPRSGRKKVPALLLFHERQKIVLFFDSKLQFFAPSSFGRQAEDKISVSGFR